MSASLKGLIAFINSQPSDLIIDHSEGFSHCALGTYLKQFEEIERSDYSMHFNLMTDDEKRLMGLSVDISNYDTSFAQSLMQAINTGGFTKQHGGATKTYGGYQMIIKKSPHLDDLA